MKTLQGLTLGAVLLVAAFAGASASEAGKQTGAVSAAQLRSERIEEVVVTPKNPLRLTVQKMRPVLPIQLPILQLDLSSLLEIRL